ncbi:hypothetical protein BGX23_002686 [Mortierella sp. AD031]|nr:hypothetical protein BGX23_002686 [Mortierella sp. AD031]
MRKAMTRDLESRITSLVDSTSYRTRNGNHTSQPNDALTRSDIKTLSYEHHNNTGDHAFQQQQQQHNSSISASFISEKSIEGHPRPQPASEVKRHGRDSQDVFYPINLGQHSHAPPQDSPAESPLTPGFSLYPPSSDAVPLVNLSQSGRNHPQIVYAQPQPLQPSPTTPNLVKGGYPTTPTIRNLSTHYQQNGAQLEDTTQRNNIEQLGPNNRLATLSFYDDLLKSISSERMIYASSLSNQPIGDDIKQSVSHGPESSRRESHNPSVNTPSIALCSSIPLSYSSCSEYDDRHSAERPVHPFDNITPSQSRFPTPGAEQDVTSAIADIYMHPLDLMDIKGGLEINLQSRAGSQESLASFRNIQKASRCGSPQSQETIENWRIHVAPSSPVIPEIDYDMHQDVHQRSDSTTPTPTAGIYDGYKSSHAENGSDSRRGTIPIILSSHLQEAAALYQDDQDYYNSAEDLHIPRPFYAYGQGRSQRQGSIQSSIGGYNYSTAASSPSLADSLSNPMYQQQANGIMNVTEYPRTFPPRKGSLPCSISSSVLDDATTPRGQQFVYQQPPTPAAYLSAHTALPTRVRPRAPSQLSNMVSRGLEAQPKRGHVRSQSQGARSSWDQSALKEAQAGYTTLIDTPPTRKDYQCQDDDDMMLRESVRMSIKAGMSLKEALAIDNYIYGNNNAQSHHHQQQQRVSDSCSFNGEIDDKMVHPLDLSLLLLQTQSRTQQQQQQQQSYDYPTRPSPAAAATSMSGCLPHSLDSTSAAQLAWDETCVGLGLTMAPSASSSSRYQEQQHLQFASTEESILTPPPRRPIPLRHHQIVRSDSNTQQEQQQQRRRPELVSKSTSGLTTHTLQSDATLGSGSYTTSATSNTFVDMPPFTSTNPYPSYAISSDQCNSNNNNKYTNDYDQDTTTTNAYHRPQQDQQHRPRQNYDQQHYKNQPLPLQRHYSQTLQQSHISNNEQDSSPSSSSQFFRRDYYSTPVQRQPSQRNKKNLVVNVSPPNQMY